MNSPSRMSPSFKNLKVREKRSPVEIKEKLRKSYKEKVQNCRSIIFNSFRGPLSEYNNNLHTTLDEIYKRMFNYKDELMTEEDELLFEEIKQELVKEELDWWLDEYEKSENIDLSALESDVVICPLCQKDNLVKHSSSSGIIECLHCKTKINCDKSLSEVKSSILVSLDRHNNTCNSNAVFTCLADPIDMHVYLICETCSELQLVI